MEMAAGAIGLSQRDTGQLTANRILAGKQDNEGCGRADEPGINVNAKGLNQALFDRMRDLSGGCGVRHRSFTSFVGEQAAFDAGQDC